MKYLILFAAIPFCFSTHVANAQLSIEQVEKSSRLGVSSGYTSNVNFQGRKIGNDQFGVTAGVDYLTASGFGFHYAADYWSGFTNTGISQHTLGLSYNFDMADWLESTISYEHWFLNAGNDTINKALDNYFTFELVADANFVKPHFTAYYIKGEDKSYGFEIGLGVPISLINNDDSKVDITPDITLMSGTDTRLTTLITKRAINRGKPIVTTNSQSIFGLLNTELTLPITYSLPRFEVSAAAHIAFPHSLSSSDIVSDNIVYYTLSLNYYIFVESNFTRLKNKKGH